MGVARVGWRGIVLGAVWLRHAGYGVVEDWVGVGVGVTEVDGVAEELGDELGVGELVVGMANDSQSGYTAISLQYLDLVDLERIYKRYGFPNDLLVHLNVWNARVRDYPSRPIYGVGERSGIRLRKVVPTISWLLFKGFFWRMREKYVIRDFHPLVFFYTFGLLMSFAGLGLGIALIVLRILGHPITAATGVLVALLLIFGSQFTLFAMWFDMESNKDLR